MSIAVTAQTLYDGPRRAKMQFTGVSDGSGNATLQTMVNAKALTPLGPGQACKRVKVERITGNVAYGIVELYWEAETPLKFVELTGTPVLMDYSNITAITPPASLLSATGNILYSTVGFAAGSTFMLELELIKGI